MSTGDERGLSTDPPLDMEIIEALGQHPLINNKIDLSIHPDLINFYKHFVFKGLDEATNKELIEKYVVPEGITPPEKINKSLDRKLSRNKKEKDRYRYEAQRDIANALSMTLGAISTLNRETESIDVGFFKQLLVNSAKLQANAIHREMNPEGRSSPHYFQI